MCMRLVLASTNNVVGAKRGTIAEMIEVEASLGRKTWSVIITIRREFLKKECYALKSKEKDNAKSKGDGHGRQSYGSSSSVEIEAK